ncbi:carbohydrate ABC transporter permease [Nocardioides fonticola]|uniref:Carbohydrate ABC transporter permease n=1 Tax=Nocardioides fonticola TaxID=450363 RepID=A0ABP7XHG1_9ACTN
MTLIADAPALPTDPAPDAPGSTRRRPRLPRRRRGEGRPPMAAAITSRRDRIVVYLVLGVLGVLWAFPMYAAIRKSLAVHGLRNYTSLISDPVGGISIPQTYLNSFIVGFLHATLVLAIAVPAGYAFSVLRWRGRELAFSLSLLFLAVPAAAMIVPVYRISNQAGLFDTYLGVALPEAVITVPFGVLLMRNFGRNVPASLVEAARVDGAGHVAVFRHLFLPLCRPALVNLIVLCFIWSIQDFMWPSIFIRERGMQTAAQAVLSLNTGLGASPTDIARYNASLVVLAIPATVIVLLGMRFLVSGLTSGGVKE